MGAALVHGEPLAQRLHFLLHFGIAIALAHALEVGLDDASQVLFDAAVAAHEGVALDIALELHTGAVSGATGSIAVADTHLLLAALVAGALHGNVAARRGRARAVGIAILVVVLLAGRRALEAALLAGRAGGEALRWQAGPRCRGRAGLAWTS